MVKKDGTTYVENNSWLTRYGLPLIGGIVYLFLLITLCPYDNLSKSVCVAPDLSISSSCH